MTDTQPTKTVASRDEARIIAAMEAATPIQEVKYDEAEDSATLSIERHQRPDGRDPKPGCWKRRKGTVCIVSTLSFGLIVTTSMLSVLLQRNKGAADFDIPGSELSDQPTNPPSSSSPSGSSPSSGPTGSAPTAPPVSVDPTASPAAPTDAPVNAIPPEADKCSLSAYGVYPVNNAQINEVCLSSPCIIEVNNTQAYKNLKNACKLARSAFHRYTVEVSCTQYNFQLVEFPACWVSEEINPVCTPDLLADVLEFEVFNREGCTETVTHTGTTDFGSQQHTCMIPGYAVASADYNVIDQVVDEILLCVTDPCIIDVDKTPAFSELRDACQAAGGAFHLFTHQVKCTGISFQYNNWPLCWESQTVNSACTIEAAEDFRESTINAADCTDVASHTETTDFSVSTPSPAKVTPSPVKETPRPVRGTPSPVKATARPVKATPRPVTATPEPGE
jgi:hypothetical protein